MIFDDRPIPPPTIPVVVGPPCPTCKVRMVVDFQLPNCRNDRCGKVRPCACIAKGLPSEPYSMDVATYHYGGVSYRTAVFCRRCGDEVTPV